MKKDKEQRYYFPPYPLSTDIALIIADTELRVNNAKDKALVKLHKRDAREYPQLKGLKSYNNKQVLKELGKPEWQPKE